MGNLSFDIAHLLAGGLVLVSFMLLYQDRMRGLLNTFALHAIVLALSVTWQAWAQGAPHLFVTALIALVFKAIVIPVSLERIISKLGIHKAVDIIGGIGTTMLIGIGPVRSAYPVINSVSKTASDQCAPAVPLPPVVSSGTDVRLLLLASMRYSATPFAPV